MAGHGCNVKVVGGDFLPPFTAYVCIFTRAKGAAAPRARFWAKRRLYKRMHIISWPISKWTV